VVDNLSDNLNDNRNVVLSDGEEDGRDERVEVEGARVHIHDEDVILLGQGQEDSPDYEH
jgi:hypothetical protein